MGWVQVRGRVRGRVGCEWVWVLVQVVGVSGVGGCGRSLVGSVGLDDKNTKSNHPTPTQSRGKGDYVYPSFNNQEAPVA